MEPVGSGAVDELKLVDLGLSRPDRRHWMAVGGFRDARAMWMDHAVLGQLVVEVDAQLCASLCPDDRAQVAARDSLDGNARAAQQLPFITPDPGLRAGQDLHVLFPGRDGHLGIRDERLHLQRKSKPAGKHRSCTSAGQAQEFSAADFHCRHISSM